MNICESLTTTAKLLPDKVALIFKDRRMTYAELDGLSVIAGQILRDAGVQAGDRVAVMLPNSPTFVVWYYAALRINAIVVSVSTRLAGPEVTFVLEDSETSALVASSETLEPLELPEHVKTFALDHDQLGALREQQTETISTTSEFVDADPDTAALILYTSGTTGFAKGATLSHGNVRSNVLAFNHLCNMRPHDTILLAVPLFHCFGQNALLNSALNVGATLVLQEKFDLNEAKLLIATHQVSQLYGVPMMFQLLLDACEPVDLASVNYCFSAAAPLPIQTSRNWHAKFSIPICEGYGLTETSPFASYNHRDHFKMGSIGTPIDGAEMKIVDSESGQTCAVGELGEIAIRGPNVMLGYWNRPEATEAAIRDGWFHSGDIGRIDEQGFFYIVDRVKDMISVGGLKVFPAEVERILQDHDAISEVAVVGTPDSVFGEQVVAFVVTHASSTDDSILRSVAAYAKANLSNYKIPRQIIPVDALPRNPSGKILKTKLRELVPQLADKGFSIAAASSVADQAMSTSSQALRSPTLRNDLAQAHDSEKLRIATQYVAKLVQQACELDDIPTPELRFLDAGLDSLMIVEMSRQLQLEVGAETTLPATLVFDCPRIVDLAEFLLRVIDQGASADAKESAERVDVTRKETPRDTQHIEAMSEEEALAALLEELE